MPENSLNPDEALFTDLFAEAGWKEITQAPPNERRVEEITQRAICETIIKDSSSFVFLGFSAALAELLSAFFGNVQASDEDYKP